MSARLARATLELERAQQKVNDVRIRLDHAQAQSPAVSPMAALRREGRDRRARYQQATERCQGELDTANTEVAGLRQQVARLTDAAHARRVWDQAEGWRSGRLPDARAELGRHWAVTVTSAIDQGDPLAYGTERLRAARTTLAGEIRRLDTDLPPDRSGALATAEQALQNVEAIHRHAVHNRDHAARRVEDAEKRRFGRRDKTVLAHAHQTLEAAHLEVGRTGSDVDRAQSKVDANGPLSKLVRSPSSRLRGLLGTPPADSAGHTAWCVLAERIDTAIDNPPPLGHDDFIDHLIH